MKVEEVVRTAASRIEVIRVRSALNPVLWMSVPVPAIFLAAAWFFREQPSVAAVLIAVAALPVMAGVAAYFVLLFRSPDRLQSEEYQLRVKELNIAYRRGRKPDRYGTAGQSVEYRTPDGRIEGGERK
jgi:hypothetical protein